MPEWESESAGMLRFLSVSSSRGSLTLAALKKISFAGSAMALHASFLSEAGYPHETRGWGADVPLAVTVLSLRGSRERIAPAQSRKAGEIGVVGVKDGAI
jgi:hypothetical protein